MATRSDSWWRRIKQHSGTIGVTAFVLVVVVAAVILGYQAGWTGFKGKTVWDWLQLLGVLAVPAVVGFGVAWFTHVQQESDQRRADEQHNHDQALEEQRAQTEREAAEKRAQTEQEIALDNQREAALQAYIDSMSALLLERQLRASQPADEVRMIARVRTLTVLPHLDKERKRSLLLFLQESRLIEAGKQIIDISGADLSEANLREAELGPADLLEVNLSAADLNNAYLVGILLGEANLSRANLDGANLDAASLHDANLTGARLWMARMARANLQRTFLAHANFEGADLTGALLNEARLLETNFRGANLIGANLSSLSRSPEMRKNPPKSVGISFSRAHLTGAKFLRADLRNVYFVEAELSNVDFSGADLTGADFTEANLHGALISAEQLATVKSLEDAIMPDGTKHA
jgi:uncharacterized protein YjbI with pentapeptide repeats